MKQPFVYIITNDRNTTLYIGVTSNIIQRIYQHKNKLIKGFSANYKLHKLIYFEQYAQRNTTRKTFEKVEQRLEKPTDK